MHIKKHNMYGMNRQGKWNKNRINEEELASECSI